MAIAGSGEDSAVGESCGLIFAGQVRCQCRIAVVIEIPIAEELEFEWDVSGVGGIGSVVDL